MSDSLKPMSRTPLPTPAGPDATMLAAIDAMLDKRLDPALLAELSSPERAAERAARVAEQRANDWPALAKYRAANAICASADMVMIGDSITEIWGHAMPELFGHGIVNRGISGQTSAQILLRFYADVIDLRPRRVHLLCGTNDIAGNTGPSVPEDYQRNIAAMADLAAANGIEMVIGSITPAATIFWSTDAEPAVWIPALNAWLREFATKRALRFVDYHAALADTDGGLQERFSGDGVHVTRAAYHLMRDLLLSAP